jgi:hypothetical protein
MGVQKIGNKNWREIVKLYLDYVRVDLRLEEDDDGCIFSAQR